MTDDGTGAGPASHETPRGDEPAGAPPPPAGPGPVEGHWPPGPWSGPPQGHWPPGPWSGPPQGHWPPGPPPGSWGAGPPRGAAGPAQGPWPPGPPGPPPSPEPGAPYGTASPGGPHLQAPFHVPPPGWQWPGSPPPPRRPERTPQERRHRRRVGLVFAAVLVVAVGAGIGIGAAIAPASPKVVAAGLVTRAATAAADAGSFRYAELSTSAGTSERIVGDAARNGGRQLITERGGSGTDIFHLLLVHGVVYFRGNAPAVIDQLHVAPAKAPSVAGKWVKVVKGQAPYHTFAVGITAKSNISQLHTVFVPLESSAVRGSSPPETRIVGGLATGKGHAVGTAVLVITTSNSRPRQLTARARTTTGAGGGVQLHWTFGRYGEKVAVSAPSGAVAYSSLGATPPKKPKK